MILVKTYEEPQINKKEILRYMGCKEATEDVLTLIDQCLVELKGKLSYKVCYDTFDLMVNEPNINLGFTQIDSSGLSFNLRDCHKAIVFAATIGIELDRLIARYSRLSPSKALCFQAIGAERIESLCNVFNDEMKTDYESKHLFLRSRFSPGYGDLGLEMQKDIFAVLDCPRKIGLSLNESLLMSPSKSVTAIIGISNVPKTCKPDNCASCAKSDCTFRR